MTPSGPRSLAVAAVAGAAGGFALLAAVILSATNGVA